MHTKLIRVSLKTNKNKGEKEWSQKLSEKTAYHIQRIRNFNWHWT